MVMRVFRYLWVSPVTVPAAVIAMLAGCTGSKLQWKSGVLEAAGGRLTTLLRVIYPPMSIAAITLGHVVLAQTLSDLESTRAHEREHVRQYELWGPFFPPLYLLASLAALVGGGDAYLDNWFERQANRL